jgi:hypothetical protein
MRLWIEKTGWSLWRGQDSHRTAERMIMLIRKIALNAKQYATPTNISLALYITLALRSSTHRTSAQPQSSHWRPTPSNSIILGIVHVTCTSACVFPHMWSPKMLPFYKHPATCDSGNAEVKNSVPLEISCSERRGWPVAMAGRIVTAFLLKELRSVVQFGATDLPDVFHCSKFLPQSAKAFLLRLSQSPLISQPWYFVAADLFSSLCTTLTHYSTWWALSNNDDFILCESCELESSWTASLALKV